MSGFRSAGFKAAHTLPHSVPLPTTLHTQAEPLRCHLSLLNLFGAPYQRNVDPFHHKLLNYLQRADANDPWLQRAWARVLQSDDRGQEALAHLQATLTLFHDATETVLRQVHTGEEGGKEEGEDGGAPVHAVPLNSEGCPMDAVALIDEVSTSIKDLVQALLEQGWSLESACSSLKQYEDAAFGSIRATLSSGNEGNSNHSFRGLEMLLESKSIALYRFAESLGCQSVRSTANNVILPSTGGQAATRGTVQHDEL